MSSQPRRRNRPTPVSSIVYILKPRGPNSATQHSFVSCGKNYPPPSFPTISAIIRIRLSQVPNRSLALGRHRLDERGRTRVRGYLRRTSICPLAYRLTLPFFCAAIGEDNGRPVNDQRCEHCDQSKKPKTEERGRREG